MWIQTQDRQKIVNSDHIISIYIRASHTTVNIYADLAKDREATYVILGEYKDRDTCLNVLEHLSLGMGSNLPGIPMPLGGEVETWAEGIEEITAANIARYFRIRR